MAIREWSAARLRRLWYAGLAVEAVLLALFFTLGALTSADAERETEARLDSLSRTRAATPPLSPAEWSDRIAAAEASLDSMGIRITRSGDTLATVVWNDSVSLTALLHEDTIRAVSLSPAARRQVERTVGPILQGIDAAVTRVLVILAAIFLPIPVALVTVTITWWRSRRGLRVRPTGAAV